MDFDHIVIFTDGACSGNPGRGGWGTIIVTPKGEVAEFGDGEKVTTNNKMELMAAIVGIEACKGSPGEIDLYTDSVYVIRGITQWIWGWRKKGWKNASGVPVANRDLWERLSQAVSARPKGSIHWKYVRGHTGVPGNERCDEIAVAFSTGSKPKLYQGPLIKYDVAVLDLPEDTGLPEPRKPSPKKAKAHSYLSYVNGIARRHASWPECDAATKGRSGAKYKKAVSAENEKEILEEWGLSLSDIQD